MLEASGAGTANEPRVRVLAGKGTCPPEDVGGMGGYYGFLEAIGDSRHPEHRDMLDWCGGRFDPDAFDIDRINEYFEKRPRRRKDA